MTELLYFTASWCGPCQFFGPILTEEMKERGVELTRIDIDEDQDTAILFGITNVPTVIAKSNGDLVARHVGAMTTEKLRNWLDSI